jgi:mannose-6-phosphate isomerase-like protein (cupin superfamily)
VRSCGVYLIPKGGKDPQSPHAEDEVYYIVRGRARISVGGEERSVKSGTIVFVPALVEHRFHDIREDLIALVLFAPAEGTTRR